MSFYGNVKNTARTQFYFDRIYPNRKALEDNAHTDGIYAGRFVLVEYEQDISADDFQTCYYYQGQMYTEVLTTEVISVKSRYEYPEEADKDKLVKINAINAPVALSLLTPNNTNSGQVVFVPKDNHIQFSNSNIQYMKLYTDGTTSRSTEGEYNDFYKNYPDLSDPEMYIINGQIYTKNKFISGQPIRLIPQRNFRTVEIEEFFQADIDILAGGGEDKEDTYLIKWTLLTGREGESTFVRNWNIDKNIAEWGNRTFDSTVWQKVFVGNNEKYILVADLNTIKPTFTFTADAPTVTPVPIHYDPCNTNTNYNIHMQTPWGLRIKEATGKSKVPYIDHNGSLDGKQGQICSSKNKTTYPSDFLTSWQGHFYDLTKETEKVNYYNHNKGIWVSQETSIPGAVYINKQGFNPAKIYSSKYLMTDGAPNYNSDITNIPNDIISLSPTGYSGRLYNDHTHGENYEAKIDTQELTIMLPSIGDSVSKMWDIVYGGVEDTGCFKRNLDINWEYANRVIRRNGLRGVTDYQGRFSDSQLTTLAGCINSIHDLMGMIIYKQTNDYSPETLEDGLIYYFPDGSYKRKAIDYTYTPVNFDSYNFEQVYLNEESYSKGLYYIVENGKYVPCRDDRFNSNYTYYIAKANFENQYSVVNLSGKPSFDIFIKAPENEYQIIKHISEDVKYYRFVNATPIKVTDKYEPYGFYYKQHEDGLVTYTLDKASTPTENRTYYKVEEELLVNQSLENPGNYNKDTGKYIISIDPATGEAEETTLKYIYCPNYFYRMETAQDGKQTLIKETRDYNSISLQDDYYIVSGQIKQGDGEGSWVLDENGNWTTSGGTTNLVVDGMYKVELLPWKDEYYVFKDGQENLLPDDIEFETPGNGELIEGNPLMPIVTINYRYLTKDKLVELYEKEFTFDAMTAVFTKFYTIKMEDAGTFYSPGIFYYKKPDGSWCFDYTEEMTIGRSYFQSVEFVLINGMKFYVPYKYYIYNEEVKDYVLCKDEFFDSSKVYYVRDKGYYVLNDDFNEYTKYSLWNTNITQIPSSVTLARRTENITLKPMVNFARYLNTIHGLILQTNKMLEVDNFQTRDRHTVQGCINQLNDIINKFNKLQPNNFLIVDDYGRVTYSHWDTLQKNSANLVKSLTASENVLHEGPDEDRFREVTSVDNMRGQWITLYLDSNAAKPQFKVHHNFQKVTDTTSTSNKNIDNVISGKDSDKLTLYTPIIDAMGHVVGKNTETVTLPYGFKTIASGADSTAVTELTTSHSNIVAESTQDTFTINTGNKWIRTATTPGSDTMTFAHTLSPISTQANTKYGLVSDQTVQILDGDNTFEVPVFQFDEAGHIIFAETHTITIPEVFESVSIVGGSTNTDDTTDTTGTITADSLKDTLNFAAGNRWMQMSHDANTDTITFKHYVKKFTETTGSTDLDSSNTFTVQEIAWDNAGHLTSSKKRTYTLQDGYKQVGVANSGANTTTSASAAAGTLTAATQVDKFTIDTGNRWITLVADETNKKVTIVHATAGTASNSKGDTTAQTPNFGSTFKVLSVGIDQTGHVKDLAEHTVKIPLPSLVDDTTGNVVVGLKLETPANGEFELVKENVGTLTLAGYTAPTGRTTGTIAATHTINGAFALVQSYLYSLTDTINNLDVTDTAKDGEFVSAVNQTNGKITVSRVALAPSVTIGAGTASAAPTVNVSVNGKSATAQSITTATTGVYGVTKLSDATNSTSTTLAATANAVKKAYDLANAAVVANTAITGATKCKITYDAKGLVTGGADLEATDIPDLSETYVSNEATFAYQPDEADATTLENLTVEQLVAKIATLEARIKTLEG